MEKFSVNSKASTKAIATCLEISCFDVEAITECQYLQNFNQVEKENESRELNECDKN